MGLLNRIIVFSKETLDYADDVRRETGKSKALILFDMLGCVIKRGVWPNQYRHNGFANLDAKQRDGHLTYRLACKVEDKLCQNKKYDIVFCNKYCFYNMFSDFFNRYCFRTDTLTSSQLEMLFEKNDRIIYKPMEGKGGEDVKAFDRNELLKSGVDAALSRIHSLPHGVLEQFISQHESLSELYPDAVNPIRVVTVLDKDTCKRIYGTLTLGLDKKYANASSGAIFALIDVDTGVVITNAIDYDHNKYTTHPSTGKQIKGFHIPMWDMVCEMLERASRRVPEVRLANWDIAITPDGPVLIEGNVDGGYLGFQFPEWAEEGIDTETAKLFVPYMNE